MAIFHGNAIPSGASFDIPYSLRHDRATSAYNQRTFSSGGNQKTWTWSGWVKRGYMTAADAVGQDLWTAVGGSNLFELQLVSGNIQVFGKSQVLLLTNRIFDDPAAWYHITFRHDSTQASASNRLRLYVNGEEETSFGTDNRGSYTQNYDGGVNTTSIIHRHGSNQSPGNHFDGYMSEVNFIDGQSLGPDSFGEVGDYGEWKPKELDLTYGTTGFRLDYSDASALGTDASSNTNNFTLVNIASSDQVTDSPTNNFATFNPHQVSATSHAQLTNGNLQLNSSVNNRYQPATQYVSSGKWYAEFYDVSGGGFIYGISYDSIDLSGAGYLGNAAETGTGYLMNAGATGGAIFNPNHTAPWTSIANLQGGGAGDVVGICLDMDYSSGGIEGAAYVYVNGTIIATGLTGNRINNYSLKSVSKYWTFNIGNDVTNTVIANFGQDGTFAGSLSAGGNTDANDIGNFKYAPSTGALAMCTSNITDAVIPSEHFNVVLYTGNGAARSINTGTNSAPDLVMLKDRNFTYNLEVYDSVRGVQRYLTTVSTGAEFLQDGSALSAFNSNGFSIGGNNLGMNKSGDNFVSWNWKAGGASVSNTNGTITSTVSANPSAGFSIVKYAGNNTINATVGHGLGIAPTVVIVKNINATGNWIMGNSNWSWDDTYLVVNTTDRLRGSNHTWGTGGNIPPTTTTFKLDNAQSNNDVNASGNNYISYCFSDIPGYSKFGIYSGDAAKKNFIHTGFSPAFVMMKNLTAINQSWLIYDTKRDVHNDVFHSLAAHSGGIEITVEGQNNINIFSNGFKPLSTNQSSNFAANDFMYMAFAETPFKNATAR